MPRLATRIFLAASQTRISKQRICIVKDYSISIFDWDGGMTEDFFNVFGEEHQNPWKIDSLTANLTRAL